MLSEGGPPPKLEDIKSPTRLLEVLAHPRVVIYFYHDWRRTNEQFGCNVCDEFGACSTEDSGAEFYEVNVPAFMREIDRPQLEQVLSSCGALEQPCVQIFENGQRMYTFRGEDLRHIRNRVGAALRYGRSDEC